MAVAFRGKPNSRQRRQAAGRIYESATGVRSQGLQGGLSRVDCEGLPRVGREGPALVRCQDDAVSGTRGAIGRQDPGWTPRDPNLRSNRHRQTLHPVVEALFVSRCRLDPTGDPIIETDQDDEPGNRAAHSLSPAYSESGCRCFPRRDSAGRSQPVPPPTRVRFRGGRSTE